VLRVSRQSGGVPEIFHSLQGEGANIGTATVFLRLAQCNLACSWCDTKYTWDWDNYSYEDEVMTLSVEDVRDAVLAYGCPHLVVTGGEPLLQQRDLASLGAGLKDAGFYCEVETNGTILPIPELARSIDQWNVSPKLANSGNPLARRVLPEVLEGFSGLPNALFKFVIATPADLDEVLGLRDRYHIPNERIILMPEGISAAALRDRSPWVADACVKEGFRFSTRLHILLWADQRGR
jgi:organic radical activating enzyme